MDELDPAFDRLSRSLMPPGDIGAVITARVARRRRRRTTSVAVASLVAVVAGAGVASAVSGGTSTASPGYADAGTPSPSPPFTPVPLPVLPTTSLPQALDDLHLTYDPSTGTLVPMPSLPSLPGLVIHVVPPLRCTGPHQDRSFVDALRGAAPTPARAVVDQVGAREHVVVLRHGGRTRTAYVVGPHGRPHLALEVFHGFAGWVWLQKTAC